MIKLLMILIGSVSVYFFSGISYIFFDKKHSEYPSYHVKHKDQFANVILCFACMLVSGFLATLSLISIFCEFYRIFIK